MHFSTAFQQTLVHQVDLVSQKRPEKSLIIRRGKSGYGGIRVCAGVDAGWLPGSKGGVRTRPHCPAIGQCLGQGAARLLVNWRAAVASWR